MWSKPPSCFRSSLDDYSDWCCVSFPGQVMMGDVEKDTLRFSSLANQFFRKELENDYQVATNGCNCRGLRTVARLRRVPGAERSQCGPWCSKPRHKHSCVPSKHQPRLRLSEHFASVSKLHSQLLRRVKLPNLPSIRLSE